MTNKSTHVHHCYVVNAWFEVFTTGGRFRIKKPYKKCIVAGSFREARDIFIHIFTQRMAHRYRVPVIDIQLIQRDLMTVKKVLFAHCVQSRKRAQRASRRRKNTCRD